MADIDMDIDVAKPGGLNDHADDDIIDFDTDMVDQHDQTPEKHSNNMEAMDRDMQDDDDAANYEAYQTNGMMNEDVDFDLHDVEDTTHNPNEADNKVNEAHALQEHQPGAADELSSKDVQEDEDYVEISNEVDSHGHDLAQDDHTSAHEIDYELEDRVEQEEPQKDPKADAPEAPGIDEAAREGAEDAPYHLEDTAEATEDAQTGHPNQTEENESVLNENEDYQQPGTVAEKTAGVGSPEGTAADELERTEYQNGQNLNDENIVDHGETAAHEARSDHEHVEGAEGADNTSYNEADADVQEHDEGEEPNIEHANHSATGDDSAVKTETEFPAITVQYKGDEFPLFSTTSDGFFADTSILDETLEKLLSGLRSELENEIAEDDELVFQVDELGLELAEVRNLSGDYEKCANKMKQSTQGELMTNVTFRQILEIFDLLVKNQDPDGSRTMYTYLFTKPNTEKRLESLIESATAGKGLDEVIHLFESPVPAGATSMLETSNAVDGLHEELDGFDSPVGAEAEAENTQPVEESPEIDGPDGDAAASQDDDEDHQEDDDGAGDAEPATEIHADALTLTESASGNTIESDAAAADENSAQYGNLTSFSSSFFTCYFPEFCLCAPCVAGYVGEHTREETEYRQTLRLQEVVEELPVRAKLSFLDRARKKHNYSHSDFSTTFSFQEADDFPPAPAGSEADPFVNLELDDSAEVDDGVDLGDDLLTEEQVTVESDAVRARTNDTSTTTTLRDEDDAGSINVDLGADATEEGAAIKAITSEENDELDEIDWRDEPEADEEGPSTPSAAGKRARGDDDEVDAEDEQDVKRRRP
ncbi:hypothetical protein FDECE_14822 [Fusarium decemcellulare]|nr:hypothetical protein FDECE_14822 [Fusarium decemcellulare]